jgi:hypothetical protein
MALVDTSVSPFRVVQGLLDGWISTAGCHTQRGGLWGLQWKELMGTEQCCEASHLQAHGGSSVTRMIDSRWSCLSSTENSPGPPPTTWLKSLSFCGSVSWLQTRHQFQPGTGPPHGDSRVGGGCGQLSAVFSDSSRDLL